MTLVVLNGDDEEILRTEVSGPGGTDRISVGELGRRSSVWRVWGGRNSDDVYVAAREVATFQKYSLHESGDWRYQWTEPKHAARYTGVSRRVLDRWNRPDAMMGGWTHGVSIWVPHGAMSDIPGDRPSKRGETTYLPEPGIDSAIGIHVVIAEVNRGFVPIKGAVPVTGFSLPSGKVVMVLASRRTLTARDSAWLKSMHSRALESAPPNPTASTARIAIFGYDDTHRWVWDLAAGTEPG